MTGSHGFAGTHLRRLLREQGWTVFGLGRGACEPAPGEAYARVDLADAAGLPEALDGADPDVVFHLAAHSGRSGEDEAGLTVRTNAGGTSRLLGALRERGRPVRVVVCGSSAQYGDGPRPDDPVDESAPLMPLGVYGWSKVAAETIALAHHGRSGIEVIAVRPFNHVGPAEPPHLVCSSFARGLARIERGEVRVLEVGDLETVRDFTDVRDVVRGYVDLVERGEGGTVYNLCSGRGTKVEDVLRMLLDKTEVTVEVRADAERAAGLRRQVGSYARIERDVGWRPRLSLEESLGDLLDHWRSRLGATTSRGNDS